MSYRTKANPIIPVRTIKDIRKNDTLLTAQEVSNLAHLSISTYNRIEQGTSAIENITLGTFIGIAQAFEMKPSELLQEMGIDNVTE